MIAGARVHWVVALEVARLFARCIALVFRPRWRVREIFAQLAAIGVDSLPIIAVSTAFAGLVVTTEIAWHMDQALHTVAMIPGFTAQFVIRELGIAIPSLLLVSKVGASITAEVGTMRVTEQIDALRLLKIDPDEYLVFPRFVAGIVATACLTWIAIFVTMVCAVFVAVFQYGFNGLDYMNAVSRFVAWKDLGAAAIKGMVYGAMMPVISCAYAYHCEGGAEGVGTATTNSVVASTVTLITLDFILTYLFSALLY